MIEAMQHGQIRVTFNCYQKSSLYLETPPLRSMMLSNCPHKSDENYSMTMRRKREMKLLIIDLRILEYFMPRRKLPGVVPVVSSRILENLNKQRWRSSSQVSSWAVCYWNEMEWEGSRERKVRKCGEEDDDFPHYKITRKIIFIS